MEIKLNNSSKRIDEVIYISIDEYFKSSTLPREEFDKLESDSEKKDFIYKDFKESWKYVQIDFISK